MLQSGVTWGKEYIMQFKVQATGLTGSQWTNVVQFTTGPSAGHGSRIPGIFFQEDGGKRHLFIFVQSTNQRLSTFIYPDVPDNVWTDVLIQQSQRGQRYVVEVVVNEEMIGWVVNPDPYVFNDVKVYASNPWDVPQPGFIKDFSFK